MPKRSRARSSSCARRRGRTKIVATHGAYHGKTLGALSVSGRESFRAPFHPLVGPVEHVPFDDLEALERALPGAAAFIVEPVQGEGGVNVPAAGYLAGARRLCDRFGALLVADEVQTGLGRCGALFACDLFGVVPDVMTLAKGLSGGVMPIGASIARPVVWNAAYGKAPLLHTSTFGGNELACAAALAALDVLVDEDLCARARDRGAQLLAALGEIALRYPDAIAAVRGAGLLAGVELRHEGYGGTIIPETPQARRHRRVDVERSARDPLGAAADRVRGGDRPRRRGVRGSDRGRGGTARYARSAAARRGALMPFVEAEITIDAAAREVYELAKEQERFPEFMPDVEAVTVLERGAGRMVTRWKTLVEEAPIEWTEEDRFDDAALRVDYKLIEGDLDTFEGTWTFEDRDGAAYVKLGVEFDFGVPTLAELIGPTLARKVRENSEMMLAGLKREAESRVRAVR